MNQFHKWVDTLTKLLMTILLILAFFNISNVADFKKDRENPFENNLET